MSDSFECSGFSVICMRTDKKSPKLGWSFIKLCTGTCKVEIQSRTPKQLKKLHDKCSDSDMASQKSLTGLPTFIGFRHMNNKQAQFSLFRVFLKTEMFNVTGRKVCTEFHALTRDHSAGSCLSSDICVRAMFCRVI